LSDQKKENLTYGPDVLYWAHMPNKLSWIIISVLLIYVHL